MTEEIYFQSKLYIKLKKIYNNDDKKLMDIFKDNLLKFNIQENKIHNFLSDYKTITYTKDNINKYINFMDYLDFNINDDFIIYIASLFKNLWRSNIINSPQNNKLKEHDAFFGNNDLKHLDILKNINNTFILSKICTNIILTDNITKHLQLYKLDLFFNLNSVTDEGIKHMNLYDLNISWNNNITDKGIKHMQLHILNLCSNKIITNEGIKNMKLYSLNLSFNLMITDDGIKHMNLYALQLVEWTNITDNGIKHMNLYLLNLLCNNMITKNSIKHMNLHTLYFDRNLNITNKDTNIIYKNIKHKNL
jgi:hypothetical protein